MIDCPNSKTATAPGPHRRRVLILGGGFGGAYAARSLGRTLGTRADVEVVLISQENYLLFTPMLNEAGRLIGDFTLARLAADRFLVFGSGIAETYHLRWFERRLHPAPVPTRFRNRHNMRPVIVRASQRITEPGAQGTTKQGIPRGGALPNVTQEAVASRAASSPCRPARRTRRG